MNKKIQIMVTTAMLATLTCIATMIIKVPTVGTNGYVNIGDVFVLISAWLLGNPFGAIAAGLGSAMADFLAGYTVYVPGTFIIKFLMAFVGVILYKVLTGIKLPKFLGFIISSIAAEAVMVGGYLLYEATALGYGWAAAASVPSNIVQGVTCLVLGNILINALSKVSYFKMMMEKRK